MNHQFWILYAPFGGIKLVDIFQLLMALRAGINYRCPQEST